MALIKDPDFKKEAGNGSVEFLDYDWFINQQCRGMKNKPSKKMQSLLQKEKVHSWRELMTTFRMMWVYLEQGLIQEGYSLARCQIYFHLYFDGPLSAVELSRRLFVTRGNISTFIKRLFDDGLLIERPAREGSKRSVYLLSKKAVRQFEQMFPEHVQRIEKSMVSFNQRTLKQFKEIQRGVEKSVSTTS